MLGLLAAETLIPAIVALGQTTMPLQTINDKEPFQMILLFEFITAHTIGPSVV
jgi:hypothetical protein